MIKMKTYLSVLFLFTFEITFSQTHGEQQLFQITENVKIDMVWIEPGSYEMGSPESEPERNTEREILQEVEITKGFWILGNLKYLGSR